MKKSLAALLSVAALCSVSLASCNKADGPKPNPNPSTPSVPDVDPDIPFVPDEVSSDFYSNFVEASAEDRLEILGLLEKYAMENNLTGIPFLGNGGYIKMSSRVNIPTKVISTKEGNLNKLPSGETFKTPIHENITGYGFGVLSEGTLDDSKPLSGVTDAYKKYYRSYMQKNPGLANMDNSKEAEVTTLNGHISSSLFGNKLGADKASYVLYPSTAKDINLVEGAPRPLPMNGNELVASPKKNETYTKYRIYVRTGDDGFKYSISSKSKLNKYNGRPVQVEDYITPLKEKHCQKNGLARGAENIADSPAEIKGIANYYDKTENGFDQAAWDNVALKTGKDDKGSYIEYEFVNPCTPFFAQYYFSTSPIPQDFIDEIGGYKYFASSNSDTNFTVVDTALSTGPYVIDVFNDQEIVYSKSSNANKDVLGGPDRYKIPGIHYAIDPNSGTDPQAAWKEFKNGKYDQVSIPKDQVLAEKNTAGTQITKPDTIFKLNINALTQEDWNVKFGKDGTIYPHKEGEYYDCKPIMANKDFIKGINFALNRQEYATNRGKVGAIDFFSDEYLIDPEEHVSYNSTETHKKVMQDYYGDAVDFLGYDLDQAVAHFKKAANKLIADGDYKAGDSITLDIWWALKSMATDFGDDIKNYIEKAWNDANTGLTLTINNAVPGDPNDIFYKHIDTGDFDFAFAAISGNPFDPLGFLDVLRSDNASGYTTNWGPDTSVPGIEYKGKPYSFDSLLSAANYGTLVDKTGREITTVCDVKNEAVKLNDDGSAKVSADLSTYNLQDVAKTDFDHVEIKWIGAPKGTPAEEILYVVPKENIKVVDGKLEVTVPKNIVDKYVGNVSVRVMFKHSILVAGFEDTATQVVAKTVTLKAA